MQFKPKRRQDLPVRYVVRVQEESYAILTEVAEREEATLTEVARIFLEIGYEVYKRQTGRSTDERQ